MYSGLAVLVAGVEFTQGAVTSIGWETTLDYLPLELSHAGVLQSNPDLVGMIITNSNSSLNVN
jgi:hypothetical protein